MNTIVAIVGRPNVGKSTFYNRMIGHRDAIVDDQSGVTRDRQYGISEWNGKSFTIVDTGGFVTHSDEIFEGEIRSQVRIAIEEADIVLFMVDVTTGITDLDEDIANILRPINAKVFLVVNKVDNNERQLLANEFWSLGFENTHFLSSISGSGTGELLDDIAEVIPEQEEEDENLIPKLAIIGQPNVGKSSLVNSLLGEDRNIVTDIAGTTRDSIHSVYNKYGKTLILIDTAGIRKKSKVHEDLEFYSVMRAINAIEESDVCILIIDATEGITSQDLNLMFLAKKRHKGIVVLVNKWDLILKETNTARDFEEEIKHKTSPFKDYPVLFISALEKKRISQALDAALEVYTQRKLKISTSKLNDIMLPVIQKNPPPAYKGRYVKIKYVTQLPVRYPAFAFFANYPKYVRDPYRLFLENKLRENFNLSGVPIDIFIRQK